MYSQFRRATILFIPALLLGLALPGSSAAQQNANPASVQRGAEVYGSTCGRCHNPRSPLERDDRTWVTIVNHMRARANLTGKEVRDVVAFLQATNGMAAAVQQTEKPPVVADETSAEPASDDPRLVALGERLVGEKACMGCHVIAGKGGNVGPNLGGVVNRRGPQFVRRKLHDPSFNNPTSMMPNFGFTAEQIEAVLAYLAQVRGSEEE